jgi:archaetidylinositol phosphate synthase
MGLYRMRSAKDNFLFHIASTARECGLTPNVTTAVGLCSGVTCGTLLSIHQTPLALFSGLLSVFCDVLDGAIARKFNQETPFGRIFDSISDRTCELAVVLGALVGGIIQPLGTTAIIGSIMLFIFRVVSHHRGFDTDYVAFGRTERLIFILLGIILPFAQLSTLCFILAGAFGIVSAVQIIVYLSRHSPKHITR